MQVQEIALQICFIASPGHAVHSGCGTTGKRQESTPVAGRPGHGAAVPRSSPSCAALLLAVHEPTPGARFPGSESGACVDFRCSPRSRPFAPPAPPPVARPCSQASLLVWPVLTSRVRASSATAIRLPKAGQFNTAAGRIQDLVVRVQGACVHARGYDQAGLSERSRQRSRSDCLVLHLQRRHPKHVFYRGSKAGLYAPLPTLRDVLTNVCARLGADVVLRCAFTVVDLHRLLLARLLAHPCENP